MVTMANDILLFIDSIGCFLVKGQSGMLKY